jgi:hypothetical protein
VEVGLEGATGCVAPDGRLVLGVSGTTGADGLACEDADGFHLIARSGDRAPDGNRFQLPSSYGGSLDHAECVFTADGNLLFSAATAVPTTSPIPGGQQQFEARPSIFRASPDGISQVIGNPVELEDGSEVISFSGAGYFAANAAGDIVLDGLAQEGTVLVRLHDGHLEKIIPPSLTREGHALSGFRDPQLTDDGEIVVLANLQEFSDHPGGGTDSVVVCEREPSEY